MNKCLMCGSTEFVYDEQRGVLFCAKCGYVIEEHVIDMGPEWRGVDKNGRSLARASPVNAAAPEQGMLINIVKLRESKLRIVKPVALLTTGERNVMELRSIVKRVVANVGLPESIIDEVVLNYRALVKMGYRGRIKETALALVYIACRRRNIPCTMKELLKNSDVNIKSFNKVYMQIASLMNIKGIYNDEQLMNMTLRMLDSININNNVKHRLILLMRDLIEKGKANGLFNGKTITSTIAAMVYASLLIYNVNVRQRDIASIAGVTDVTIRNRYNELLRRLNFRIII
jgi:transcription initiation factor TFIIB